MDELDFYRQMKLIAGKSPSVEIGAASKSRALVEHRAWLRSLRLERPNPGTSYRVGVYIRYFNQTKYENYLDYHVKQFSDTIALCPKWQIVDYYIDEGASAPKMENAPEWSRLIQGCFDGKVDLILTQKISNVSRDPFEISLLSRMLASLKHPVGIYFISEDVFTCASYYMEDLHDTSFFPSPDWELLPDDDDEDEVRMLPNV